MLSAWLVGGLWIVDVVEVWLWIVMRLGGRPESGVVSLVWLMVMGVVSMAVEGVWEGVVE